MERENAGKLLEACFVLALSGIYFYGIGKLYGPIRFPDEFGYWSHGARLSGYDWSEVSALHPYYSFGYGCLMAPLMALIPSPTDLYRAAVSIHFMLLILGYLALKRVLGMLMQKGMYTQTIIGSSMAFLYSSFIVYAQTSLPETLLTVLYLLLVMSVLQFSRRPGFALVVVIAALSGGLYFVHMRTLGVGLALWLVLACESMKDKALRPFALVGGLLYALLMLAGLWYKRGLIQETYDVAASSLAAVNDFGGQIGKIARLASARGMFDFICSFGGKLFYLGSATGGVFYWGAISMARLAFGRRPSPGYGGRAITARFILVSALLTLMLVSVFMIDSPRVDGVIYGRYSEMLLPVFIGAGLLSMAESPRVWRGTIYIICFQSVMMYLTNWKIGASGAYGIYRHSIPAVTYALELSGDRVYEFTKNVYLGGTAFSMVVAAAVWAAGKGRRFRYLICIWAFIQCGLGMGVCSQMNYRYNEDNRSDIEMAARIREMGRPVIYLYSDQTGYVDLLQYCLKEIPVHVVRGQAGLSAEAGWDDIVVTGRHDVFSEELSQNYGKRWKTSHLEVYYN